jgi:hypothetical protein
MSNTSIRAKSESAISSPHSGSRLIGILNTPSFAPDDSSGAARRRSSTGQSAHKCAAPSALQAYATAAGDKLLFSYPSLMDFLCFA